MKKIRNRIEQAVVNYKQKKIDQKLDGLSITVKKLSPSDNDILVFNVDIGNLPEKRAIEYVQGLIKRYREIKENNNETLWMFHRKGNLGSDVSILPFCKSCMKEIKET